jgi:HAE1 family hydrophobic/amphiphilic exporter-1
MSITQIAIKRPTMVVVFFSVLAILGIVTYTKLNYELIPKLNFPVVSIVTAYPGASAKDVEGTVTKVMEDALSSLDRVKSIKSTSMEGVSTIVVELIANTNADLALQNAQRKINAITYLLPVGVKTPALNKFSSDEIPVIRMGITANMEPTKLYDLLDNQIRSQLSNLSGVGQVSLVGGVEL